MTNQCQHFIETQGNELLKLLEKFEELFNGTLGTWKKDPVDFELKKDANPICPILYPVLELHEIMLKKRLSILL